jgi:hypothetical protein
LSEHVEKFVAHLSWDTTGVYMRTGAHNEDDIFHSPQYDIVSWLGNPAPHRSMMWLGNPAVHRRLMWLGNPAFHGSMISGDPAVHRRLM